MSQNNVFINLVTLLQHLCLWKLQVTKSISSNCVATLQQRHLKVAPKLQNNFPATLEQRNRNVAGRLPHSSKIVFQRERCCNMTC